MITLFHFLTPPVFPDFRKQQETKGFLNLKKYGIKNLLTTLWFLSNFSSLCTHHHSNTMTEEELLQVIKDILGTVFAEPYQ
jgi:hypothetical protein